MIVADRSLSIICDYWLLYIGIDCSQWLLVVVIPSSLMNFPRQDRPPTSLYDVVAMDISRHVDDRPRDVRRAISSSEIGALKNLRPAFCQETIWFWSMNPFDFGTWSWSITEGRVELLSLQDPQKSM